MSANQGLKEIDQYLIVGGYVTQGGKISKFGTIKLLANCVPEPTRDEDAGLECWSPVLYEYRNKGFKAEVCDDGLIVLNEKTETVAYIQRTEIFPVHMRFWHRVQDGGWALAIFRDSTEEIVLHAIKSAEKGEKPTWLDNSGFIKVSPQLIGSKLLVLGVSSNTPMENAHLVFTEEGEKVEHEVFYPISFKKWAPDHNLAQYSRE